MNTRNVIYIYNIDNIKNTYNIVCRGGSICGIKNNVARIPERSKGTDLRSVALASWVRIPLRASNGNGKSPGKRPPPSNWGEIITRTDAVLMIFIIQYYCFNKSHS